MAIHRTAVVDSRAEIDPTADIGPYVVIDGAVKVGPRTRVGPHVHLTGWTEIGADCEIHATAVIGGPPQDLSYDGSESYCRIGDGTVLREAVTVHRGTDPGSSTVVGKRCFLMATSHVAHNCVVEDDVKLANGVLLGGHVHVGRAAFLGGGAAVHQFVRVGELALPQGNAVVTADLPPFSLSTDVNCWAGVNVVGMRRAGFSPEDRREIQQAFRILYRPAFKFGDAIEQVAELVKTEPGKRLVAFLRAPSRRGIMSGRRRRTRESVASE